MPNPNKNHDQRAGRLLRLTLSAVLPSLALLLVSIPAGAQESTISSAPSIAKPAHHAKTRTAMSEKPAKEASAGSSDDANSPFALTASKGPINIQSDQLALDYKGKAVLFSGHVHAIQSGSEMTCDTLHVNYEQNFKDVKDMTADGNVRISQGGRYSTSDHAVMNEKVNTVVLTGNPVVHDGPDQITGDRITVYLKTGKSIVEHAHALIYRDKTQTADNGSSDTSTADDQPTAVDPAASAPAAGNASAPPADGH